MRSISHLPTFLRGLVIIIPQRPRQFSTAKIMGIGKTPNVLPAGGLVGTSGRTYEDALALLDTLQSNRTVVSSVSKSNVDMNAVAIPEMLDWTKKAGYGVEDLVKGALKCLHVAGTKGKGSVCAMLESILSQYRMYDEESTQRTGKGLGKTGLYTSPHLVTVRERIRIEGLPISEPLFTKYFFELWERFTHVASNSIPPHPDPASAATKPGYFRFLTILAFHVFLQEGIETAIVECGIGGEYDSTNILPKETVSATAITRLGIDHTGMLGETIEEIAWHKAGIMKTGIPAFTVVQLPEAQAVLAQRATQKGVTLEVVERSSLLDKDEVKIGLAGDFQKDNASLAVAIAASHLKATGLLNAKDFDEGLPEKFRVGLQNVHWPGRCQVRSEGNIIWLLDGAHTDDSLKETARWYHDKLEEFTNPRLDTFVGDYETMLIFNQQERDPVALLTGFLTQIRLRWFSPNPTVFNYASFCTNQIFGSTGQEDTQSKTDLTVQENMGNVYKVIDRNGKYVTHKSIEEAITLARRISNASDQETKLIVLVTGSLHLVGGVLQILDQATHRRQ